MRANYQTKSQQFRMKANWLMTRSLCNSQV